MKLEISIKIDGEKKADSKRYGALSTSAFQKLLFKEIDRELTRVAATPDLTHHERHGEGGVFSYAISKVRNESKSV